MLRSRILIGATFFLDHRPLETSQPQSEWEDLLLSF